MLEWELDNHGVADMPGVTHTTIVFNGHCHLERLECMLRYLRRWLGNADANLQYRELRGLFGRVVAYVHEQYCVHHHYP